MDKPHYQAMISQTRGALDDTIFQALWEECQVITLTQVIAYALPTEA